MAITIEQIPVPLALEDAAGGDFRESAEVSNAVELDTWGHDDFAVDAGERLVILQSSPDREAVLGVARDGGRIVAVVRLLLPLRDNLHTGHVQIEVLPSNRRKGIATALLTFAERHPAERGRTTVMSWSDTRVDHVARPELVLVPESGAGGFPAEDPSARFAVGSGFAIVQVDRQSVLDLGSPAGSIVSIARQEEDVVLSSGASSLVSALHRARLGGAVGHTLLERFTSRPAVVYQEDTLVLNEHRGHRLGAWLMSANQRRVRQEWPGARRVHTWNAEESTFMLDVEVALGFRPSGRTAGWRKVLPAP